MQVKTPARELSPEEFLRLHRNRLHNEYHNFKVQFVNAIANGTDPGSLYRTAKDLIDTIQACAQNANRFMIARNKHQSMDVKCPAQVRQFKSGELLVPYNPKPAC
ncbi:MAG: hypothetical protein IPK91_02615 [Saprospiraceae bacterium]|nr:hypothetical protein [Saprospiraceae bacterium]MBK8296182.1 hypothetical protein [Saprospiraceae bacterium]